MIYMILLTNSDLNIYLFYRLQIFSLIAKKIFIKTSIEYSDFPNMFILKLAFKVSKYIKINNHIIKVIDS